MKIVFMGTPEFTVPVLESIYNSSHQIVGVYTQAPEKSGRGQKLKKAPIHRKADELGLEVFTPKNFKTKEEVARLSGLEPDYIIVAGYGIILKQNVLEIPKIDCINIHPSALPRWRGAAPVERTIEAGDTETAVCIMKVDTGVDSGDIILREDCILTGHETSSSLYKALFKKGAELILENIDHLPNIIPTKQNESGMTYAKKISKEEGLINWLQTAQKIQQKIRAFDNYPNCWFHHNGENIKILSAKIITENSGLRPGTIVNDSLHIQTANHILQPTMLQRPGKKIVDIKSFLNGTRIPVGTKLNAQI